MPTYVTPDELQRIKALSAMAKAFPDDASDVKAKKKDWWDNIRDKYDLGDEDKYKIGLDTGEIRLKNGAATDAPPAPKRYIEVSVPVSALRTQFDDGNIDYDSTPVADGATIDPDFVFIDGGLVKFFAPA